MTYRELMNALIVCPGHVLEFPAMVYDDASSREIERLEYVPAGDNGERDYIMLILEDSCEEEPDVWIGGGPEDGNPDT